MNKQQIEEMIADLVSDHCELGEGCTLDRCPTCKPILATVSKILSIPGLAVLDEDQGLPEPPVIAGDRATDYYSGWYAAMKAAKEAGFRKVKENV